LQSTGENTEQLLEVILVLILPVLQKWAFKMQLTVYHFHNSLSKITMGLRNFCLSPGDLHSPVMPNKGDN